MSFYAWDGRSFPAWAGWTDSDCGAAFTPRGIGTASAATGRLGLVTRRADSDYRNGAGVAVHTSVQAEQDTPRAGAGETAATPSAAYPTARSRPLTRTPYGRESGGFGSGPAVRVCIYASCVVGHSHYCLFNLVYKISGRVDVSRTVSRVSRTGWAGAVGPGGPT